LTKNVNLINFVKFNHKLIFLAGPLVVVILLVFRRKKEIFWILVVDFRLSLIWTFAVQLDVNFSAVKF